jgi:hypothetical protein
MMAESLATAPTPRHEVVLPPSGYTSTKPADIRWLDADTPTVHVKLVPDRLQDPLRLHVTLPLPVRETCEGPAPAETPAGACVADVGDFADGLPAMAPRPRLSGTDWAEASIVMGGVAVPM